MSVRMRAQACARPYPHACFFHLRFGYVSTKSNLLHQARAHIYCCISCCSLHVPRQLPPERTHTNMFKQTHVFVEMDELDSTYKRDPMTYKFGRVEEWKETHRWNLGLQEDLDQ
jgi:hypothetical protein